MKAFLFCLLAVAATILCAASLLPAIPSTIWWIRVADFPRLQISILLALLLIATVFFLRRYTRSATVLIIALTGVLAYQAVILLPYLPTGADLARSSCAPNKRLSVMVANVRLTNAPDGRLMDQVRRIRPDLFLVLEADKQWTDALAPLKQAMPYQVIHPTGSYFGIALYSRLPLVSPEVRHLAGQNTPQIKTGVRMRDGEVVDFLGIHPRPPHPSQSALGRDAVLMKAGLLLRDNERPGVIAGDLNAVPWESAVARMQTIAQLVDPRRGYGYLPTYNAQSWWMAWPLDHVFYEPGFAVTHLARGENFGSDHYPYVARLCRVSSSQSELPERPDSDTVQQARDIIQRARRQASEQAAP